MFKNKFHLVMWTTAIGSGLLLAVFAVLYHLFSQGICLTLAITFGTICYHFSMRLLVGGMLHPLHRKSIPTESVWFRPKAFEPTLYRILRVKKWKRCMPTYNPEEFSLETYTPELIVRTMCVSELVHECNVLLSFAPLFMVLVFGDFWVFFLTSLGAACYDMLFVLLQRYNRPRVKRLLRPKTRQST